MGIVRLEEEFSPRLCQTLYTEWCVVTEGGRESSGRSNTLFSHVVMIGRMSSQGVLETVMHCP